MNDSPEVFKDELHGHRRLYTTFCSFNLTRKISNSDQLW